MKIIEMKRLAMVCVPLLLCVGCDSRGTSSDPVVKEIAADIGTPIYFVLMNEQSLYPSGYFSDWNRILKQSDIDISVDQGLEPLLHIDHPTFSSVTQQDWLVQAVLRPMIGTGLIFESSSNTDGGPIFGYRVSPDLQKTALTGDRALSPYNAGTTFRIYNLGVFELRSADMINEYAGSDQSTGAATKFRSYRALIQFHPTAATAQVYDGVFPEITCTVVAELNQTTLQWQFASDACALSKS